MEAAFGGNAWFLRAGGAQVELFPLGEPVWDIFRQIVAAVLAGDFSEVGNPADAIGRIAGPNGTRTFGPARVQYLSRWDAPGRICRTTRATSSASVEAEVSIRSSPRRQSLVVSGGPLHNRVHVNAVLTLCASSERTHLAAFMRLGVGMDDPARRPPGNNRTSRSPRMLRHVQRRWVGRTMGGLGVAAVVVALTLALWPLHSDGLRGNAIAPRYSTYVGFYSLAPLPAHPTTADFRRAGITLPRDRVANGRRDAETLAAVGILVTGIGMTVYRNAGRRKQQP